MFFKFDPIILFSDSSLGSGIYNHVLPSSIAQGGGNSDLILPARDTPIFGTDSADYGPKLERYPTEFPGRWAGLKDNPTSYRLNSSIPVAPFVIPWSGKPSSPLASEGRVTENC